MSQETQGDAGRIVFCPARAFQINFSFPDDLAAKVAARPATRFAIDSGEVKAIAYNRISKVEARFTRVDFEKAFSVSLASLAAVAGIAEIEQVLVSAYETGTIVTRLICRLSDPEMARNAARIEQLDADMFQQNEPLVRGVFRFVSQLADARLIKLSSVLPFDGVTLATDQHDKQAAANLETAFVRGAEWRGWSANHVLVTAKSISAETRARFGPVVSASYASGPLNVAMSGFTLYWFVEADSLSYAAIADNFETANYLLAKRCIIAGATETLRAASDTFVSGEPRASGKTLRRYKAQVRGALARVHVFRVSTTAPYRNLFLWLEGQLASLAQGLADYKDAEETACLAIEDNDRGTVERISRGVNAVFMLFAAIAFVGVVADALGFVDFNNNIIPFPVRVVALTGATLLALAAAVWSLVMWKQSDAD